MSGVECRLQVEPGTDASDRDTAVALFRIAQKALKNVARHAGASRVAIQLCREEGGLLMREEDDVRGFGEGELEAPHSLGVMGTGERAYPLGGTLEIYWREGGRMVMEVKIPHG